MNTKFWIGYTAFFVFVFPLFFSFGGSYGSSALWATVALILGLLGWMIFIRVLFVMQITKPKHVKNTLQSILEEGKRRQGIVIDKELIKHVDQDKEHIRILVQFPNRVGTVIEKYFEITDTMPYQKRYERGSTVNLRIANDDRIPGVILADTQISFSATLGLGILLFVLCYMVGTFLWHYSMYSDGKGWRFLSLYHPWVFTPFIGILMFRGMRILVQGSPEKEERLLLGGKKAEARVQRAEQTGTMINDQPEIRFTLQFMDEKGKEYNVKFKKIVLLTEMHLISQKTRTVLYLPEDPQQVMFI